MKIKISKTQTEYIDSEAEYPKVKFLSEYTTVSLRHIAGGAVGTQSILVEMGEILQQLAHSMKL